MQYVRLGATGLKVSRLSFGTLGYGDPKWHDWTLDEAASRPFFKAALEKGINFFDTADAYSAGVSETVTGNALKDMAKRDDVVIATKVCRPMGPGPNQKGLSRKHIMESIDASLKRLKTDYVDLYVIHRADPETPMEETLDALNDVVRAGKALYLGASSMYAWQFSKMLTIQRERGWAPFVSMQNLYNLVYREEEREMHPLCVAEGIALTPYSPNARGFLAGNTRSGTETTRGKNDKVTAKMQLGASAQDHAIADRVADVAKQVGAPMASVALAWVLAQKGVTSPVIGASKMSHLDDALKALDLKLSLEQMKSMEEPYKPKPVVAMD